MSFTIVGDQATATVPFPHTAALLGPYPQGTPEAQVWREIRSIEESISASEQAIADEQASIEANRERLATWKAALVKLTEIV